MIRTLCLTAILAVGLSATPAASEEAENLPFIKAAAYAAAIDDYCSTDRRYSSADLHLAALRQELLLAHPEIDRAFQKASDHLQSDQSACAPAMAFVDKAVALISELSESMTKMEEVAAQEKAAREAAARQAEMERKATEAAERLANDMSWCADRVANARRIIEESKPLLNTVFAEALPRCLLIVPESPATKQLRLDIRSTIEALMPRLEAEKHLVEEQKQGAARPAQ